MLRPRCPYCKRPVGRFWLRCRVCRTRLAAGYVLLTLAALAALSLLAFCVFRGAAGPFHP